MLEINTRIIFGNKKFSLIKENLANLNFKKSLVFCDINLYNNSKYVRTQIEKIKKSKKSLQFYDYPFEPSYEYIDYLLELIKKKGINKTNIDSIIAIGGGSAIDAAKALAILFTNDRPSLSLRGFPKNIKKPIPLIAVPSTAGTGTEVVYNAPLIDLKTKIKLGINSKENYPVLAILDPLIVSSAPFKVYSSTGCDTLVHTLESFVSVKSNYYTRQFSMIAYKLISENFKKILLNKASLNNWLNMQWAAVYAIIALSNTTSGPAGALSSYLGCNYNVNHGIAGGAFIGKISEVNFQKGYYDYSLLYNNSNKSINSKKKKSEMIIKEINFILKLAKIPKSLDSFNVDNEDKINDFLNFCKTRKKSFGFNPVKITRQDLIKKILI